MRLRLHVDRLRGSSYPGVVLGARNNAAAPANRRGAGVILGNGPVVGLFYVGRDEQMSEKTVEAATQSVLALMECEGSIGVEVDAVDELITAVLSGERARLRGLVGLWREIAQDRTATTGLGASATVYKRCADELAAALDGKEVPTGEQ